MDIHTATEEAYKRGFDDGRKAKDKYRWHDLRKDPEDLPELFIRKELWFGGDLYSVGDFCGDYWNTDLYRGAPKEAYRIPIIAWRDIEPYEEVEG